MERWYYTTGTEGETEITIPVLAGKTIYRVYRDGVEWRPSEAPAGKEFSFDFALGKFTFSLPFFFTGETLDIPYEDNSET